MSKIIASKYEGNYKSATQTPLNDSPIVVNGASFSPVDLLAGAYGSCLMGTIDHEARKSGFNTTGQRSELTYEWSGEKNGVAKINVKLFFENEYTTEQKQVIEHAAKTQCHVGNSLDPNIVRVYEFLYNQK